MPALEAPSLANPVKTPAEIRCRRIIDYHRRIGAGENECGGPTDQVGRSQERVALPDCPAYRHLELAVDEVGEGCEAVTGMSHGEKAGFFLAPLSENRLPSWGGGLICLYEQDCWRTSRTVPQAGLERPARAF